MADNFFAWHRGEKLFNGVDESNRERITEGVMRGKINLLNQVLYKGVFEARKKISRAVSQSAQNSRMK